MNTDTPHDLKLNCFLYPPLSKSTSSFLLKTGGQNRADLTARFGNVQIILLTIKQKSEVCVCLFKLLNLFVLLHTEQDDVFHLLLVP